MKIALIGPVHPYRGGIAHFTTRLYEGLIKQHHVDVISYSKMYPKLLYPGKTNLDQSTSTFTTPAEFILNPINPFSWIKTKRRIKSLSPDLVLIQWWTTFLAPCTWFLGSRLSKLNIPIAFIVHNVLPHESNPVDSIIARCALATGKGFIVQSHNQDEQLRNLIHSNHIYYCPHPVYDQFIDPTIDKTSARKRFNLHEKDFVLLFFGIVRPYKGLKFLLTAVSTLLQTGFQVKVIIAGEFWEREQDYIKLITDLGIKDAVIIDNRYIPNEEVTLYFKAADVFVAPYVSGTQSGALKIALAFGLPIIISSAIKSDPWMTAQPRRCTIVDPQDTLAFAKAIAEMMVNKNETELDTAGINPYPSWDEFVLVIEKMMRELGV